MNPSSAYMAGASEALESFGIRTAGDLMGTKNPAGPPHLGAEWLAKKLTNSKEEYGGVIGSKPSHRKLERDPQWGARTSLEAGNATGSPGVGHYGGV